MIKLDISLYGILDPDHCNGRDLGRLAKIAAENGATILQYRAKQKSTREMILQAKSIISSLEGLTVPLIVNDRVDVALASGADGVHIGQSDMHANDARKILGTDKIIGLSIKTLEDAKTAPLDHLDYAFIGGVFDTQTKDNPPGIGIEGWQQRAAILHEKNPDLPLGAIAGITKQNVSSLINVGVDGVALISHLFKADDVAASCSEFKILIENSRGSK